MKENTKYLLALNCSKQIGARYLAKLRKVFKGDWERVWREKRTTFVKHRLPQNLIEAVFKIRREVNPEQELKRIKTYDIEVVTLGEDNYPELLSNLFDPPIILYYKGSLLCLGKIAVAVVGSRRLSQYGRQVARDIASYLGESGVCVVSGLALGIDRVAHEACLDSGGKTLGVLANGLDSVYPASHKALAERIIEQGGALVSEYPVGHRPQRFHFPIRNRIIAGLSQAVVIIEATMRSGSLITARIALEEGRDVLAVPHSIYNQRGEGVNNLIKQGATPITSPADVLSALGIENSKSTANKMAKKENLSPLENQIISLLKTKPKQMDELVRQCGRGAPAVLQALSHLEIAGIVQNAGALGWVLGR